MNRQDAHLFEQIAETLRLKIARGELAPGDRLPTVRALAREWECTTGTVSRAFALLADEGVITTHRGRGTRVADKPPPPETDKLAWGSLVNQAERFLLELLSQGYSDSQVQTAVATAISRWQSLTQSMPPPPPNQLRFAGSHDMSMELLTRQLNDAHPQFQLSLQFRGSLGGLIAIARQEADIAGIHLWDEQSDSYNIPYVRRILPGQRAALLTVATRRLGLLLPAGNPQQIHALADLTRSGVRWINRQPGSGTRVWLEVHLQRQGIDHARIKGYQNEVSTHLQVAEAIQSRQATAGLGLQAAAAGYGLNFMPLTAELYQLVIPERVWETAVCRRLVRIVQSNSFKSLVDSLGGYDSSPTGEITWIS